MNVTARDILVTGARGTIGRALVHELRARGHSVAGCDLMHTEDPLITRADVANYRELEAAFENAFDRSSHPGLPPLDKPRTVYHLAGEFGRFNGEKFYEQVWITNAIGTRNVLELCRKHDAHLIFASSSEIYGESSQPLTEDLPDKFPIRQLNEYALSKWANEIQIRNFALRYPTLDWTILRFFNAYGNERYTPFRSVASIFCHYALRGEMLPVYEGYSRVFMHMRDFIPTLAAVCSSERKHNIYNIGGNDYRSVKELAEIVVQDVGRGEIELIPEDRHNVRSKRPVNWRAASDFGHQPMITIEEGIPMYLDWLAKKHMGATAW